MTGDFKFGFRHDPMGWVENESSLAAAMVRTFVFGRSLESDREMLDAGVQEILFEQKGDGSFGDNSKETGTKLLELLEQGISHDATEVLNATVAILRQTRLRQIADEWYEEDGKVLSIYALHALCLLDVREQREVIFSLKRLVERPEIWNGPWEGCPWTPAVFWRALWAGRGIVDTEETVLDGIRRITEQMNEAGCCAYNDPWGFTDAAGRIEAPEARALVAKQIPMILRAQHPDGGFGGVSVPVFRALKTHGFLEPLRELPPLQDDWRVVREIPLPEGMWFSLAWDGKRLWSFDHKTKAAVALSTKDGSEKRRVGIENCRAIGWWDKALISVGSQPKELKKINPKTGEVLQTMSLEQVEKILDTEVVEGRILVGDGFLGAVSIIDPQNGESRTQCLAGPFPACLAAEGENVWHADRRVPAIIKSDLKGRLLDWGGKTFGIQGMAFDGKRLWALDGEARRIAAIERIV